MPGGFGGGPPQGPTAGAGDACMKGFVPLREDAEKLIGDFQQRAQHYSEEIKVTTAAAKVLQDTIRQTRAQMMRRIEAAPAEVA